MKDNLKYLHDFILGQIRMSNEESTARKKVWKKRIQKNQMRKKNLISILKYGTKQLIE